MTSYSLFVDTVFACTVLSMQRVICLKVINCYPHDAISILRVTVCECRIEMKGYLLTYLLTYLAQYMLWSFLSLCWCPSQIGVLAKRRTDRAGFTRAAQVMRG